MQKKATLTLSGLLLAILAFWLGPDAIRGSGAPQATGEPSAAGTDRADVSIAGVPGAAQSNSLPPATPRVTVDTRVGFTSSRALSDHFRKHGRQFGSVDEPRYLRLAQELRDVRLSDQVLEAVRADGVITRFDKRTGAFIAFNDNKKIRTFFKPNDGIRYFERQLDKEH